MSPVKPQSDGEPSPQGYPGQAYWRSLQHRAESPQLLADLAREFPNYDPQELASMSRRGFMRTMAASLALAGLTLSGCRRWPEKELAPFGEQPEGTMPGAGQYYATMLELAGVATGVLVRSFDGRPIKVEGNPLHPYSLGAADIWSQASVLSLYDPDRSRFPQQQVRRSDGSSSSVRRTWQDFDTFAEQQFAALRAARGQRLAVLIQPTCSPTLLRLRDELLSAMPQAMWCTHEPLSQVQTFEGSRQAFGQVVRPQYDLAHADVVCCIDADLLGMHPAHQRHAHDWAARRRTVDRGVMNRMYAVESNFSITGSVADRRLAVRPSNIGAVLRAVASELGISSGRHGDIHSLTEQQKQWAVQLAGDLGRHRSRSLLAVGPAQPAWVHALAHRINEHLGNLSQTLRFTHEPLADTSANSVTYAQLHAAVHSGAVHTLVIMGSNPAYDGPADQSLDLNRTNLTSIHLGAYVDETGSRCTWHLPMAHGLECWSDGCAWDGAYSVQQPLILPLFDGRSSIQLLAGMLGQPIPRGDELVRTTAGKVLGDASEQSWRRVLHDGIAAESRWPQVVPEVVQSAVGGEDIDGTVSDTPAWELLFVHDSKVYDGRFANNGWLQELPDAMTKLTWDNAALISKADADRLGIDTGHIIAIERSAANRDDSRLGMQVPAYIMPGLAQGTLVLPMGYGRTMAGHVGNQVGFNASALRSSGLEHVVSDITVTPTRRRYRFAMTQDHHLIDAIGMWGREKRVGKQGESGYLVREADLGAYRRDRHVFRRKGDGSVALELFDPPSQFNEPHAWGMAIDLNNCIGCNACIVACQAENNVPVVGKEQVAVHREMHWLRVDRYFKGSVDDPEVVHMPLACAQCETAPCEQVCPVAATVHDSEGLNVMVYNRCIGTRYCANNCPFKVRRFNYFDYHATDPRGRAKPWLGVPDTQTRSAIDELKRMLFNPDVTVRMRGVMEKCTYCTQRIQEARITARTQWSKGERDSHMVRDGEVTPACAQTCPTQAIVFGDLNDPQSRVSQLQRGNRAYSMLNELNLRPRTRYLAKVRNGEPSEETSAIQVHPSSPTA